MDTINSRKKIGFPKQKEDWTKVPAIYDAHTLRISGHPVMEDWENNYMNALAKIACNRNGIVLELGFGMGISAKAIQNSEIDNHYIIECHPDVVSKCIKDFRDAINRNRLHIFTGFWQEIVPLLRDAIFDGILFDTYPLTANEIHSNHFSFFRDAYRLLKKGGLLTYYSDEELNFSKKHLEQLIAAGFTKENINFDICKVNPPKDCEYWQKQTLIVPIIKKL